MRRNVVFLLASLSCLALAAPALAHQRWPVSVQVQLGTPPPPPVVIAPAPPQVVVVRHAPPPPPQVVYAPAPAPVPVAADCHTPSPGPGWVWMAGHWNVQPCGMKTWEPGQWVYQGPAYGPPRHAKAWGHKKHKGHKHYDRHDDRYDEVAYARGYRR